MVEMKCYLCGEEIKGECYKYGEGGEFNICERCQNWLWEKFGRC